MIDLQKWKEQHTGLSRTKCAAVAQRLIKEAHESHMWFDLIDQLAHLRDEMHHFERAEKGQAQ